MLALALILDALLGEPEVIWRRVPHPAALIGRLTDWLEARLNHGSSRKLKGVVALVAIIVACWVPAALLSLDFFFGVFEIIGAAVLLAHRSLVDHVMVVVRGLDAGLGAGRVAVAQIVGRDPETLDEAGVARAAIESTAENFSDGVVAPAFWFLIGGLPAMAVYKAVNTADSMIGHRNSRYQEFGWAAARLDDLLNWIPARLTGWLFCLVGRGQSAVEVMRRDAWLHRSPNAGWPEAAMAASLDVALAGPRVYDGQTVDDPYINPLGRKDASSHDIEAAVALVWRAWSVLLGIGVVLWLGAALLF